MQNEDSHPQPINGEIVSRMLYALAMAQPDASGRTGVIGEVFASVVCNIPEADWQAILADSQGTCKAPETGCQCQVLKDVFAAFDVMRKGLPTVQEMRAKQEGMPPPGLPVFPGRPLEA